MNPRTTSLQHLRLDIKNLRAPNRVSSKLCFAKSLEMSVNFAKRSACDRCREHKVRCPRTEQNSDHCTRCLRARVSCITSSARPLGRPRKVLGDSKPHGGSHSKTSPSSTSGSQPQDSTPHTASSLSQTASTLPWQVINDSNGLFDSTQLSNSPSDDWDGSSSWQIDGEYDFPILTSEEQASILCLQEQGAIPDARHSPLGHSPPIQPYPPRQGDLVDPIEENTSDPIGDLLIVEEYPRNYQFHNLSDTRNSTIFLSHLNETIAQHLADIYSLPSDLKQTYASCVASIQSSPVNPIVSVLQSTSKFASFLQVLRASSCSSSQSPSRDYNGPGSPTFSSQPSMRTETSSRLSALDIPMVLMLLAGHLQLIRLLDAIFWRCYIFLRESPYEEISASQPLPGLNLGGLPITQGHLHFKIILQVLEHNLQQVERFIGLPPEYRLYERQDSDQGILSDLESPMLLQAVLEQVNGARGMSGICHIASLKDNMQKVQGILHC